ncbi:MAG: DUF998 domain-containing protein [Acidimicrobiales bacterium]
MRTRSLLGCGAVAGPVFVAGFVVGGRAQPSYDPRRQAVSDLARTDLAPLQTATFLAGGALLLAGAAGARRALRPGVSAWALPVAVGAVGAGMACAGVFPTDTAEEIAEAGLSRRGTLHVASAVPVFVGTPLAAVLGARRLAAEGRTGWAALSVAAGAVSLAAAAATGGAMSEESPLAHRAGTFQRTAIVAGLGWVSLFARWLRQRT